MNCKKVDNPALVICVFLALLILLLSVQLFSTYQTLKKYEEREARREMLTKIDTKIIDIQIVVAKINALQATINCLMDQNKKLQEQNSTTAVGTVPLSSAMPDCNKYMNEEILRML